MSNNNNNNGSDLTTPEQIRKATKAANKTAAETGSMSAGVGQALGELQAAPSVGDISALLQSIRADQSALLSEIATLRAAATAPKVRTVRVQADGKASEPGKRGKPRTEGFDDCRLSDGSVRKVGLRMYSHEVTRADLCDTYTFGKRGAVPAGVQMIAKSGVACPYDEGQQLAIQSVSSLTETGLRFRLVAVTDKAFKMVPARTITEAEAVKIAPLLAPHGLEADLWCKLRTTVDGSGDGEIASGSKG